MCYPSVVAEGREARVLRGDGAAALVLGQLPGLVPVALLDQLDLARGQGAHLVAPLLVHDAQLVGHLALVHLALGLDQRVDDDEALEAERAVAVVRVQDLVRQGRGHLAAVRLTGDVQVTAPLPREHDEELAEGLDQRAQTTRGAVPRRVSDRKNQKKRFESCLLSTVRNPE
ncbi:Cadherin EGF LAG seven-pass G-type receptor 3 [Frankliniella fusca]|uniref:Cadherin EGF LAG seven-pass G-type receptor 3 n=1 Tax=Frankliniella fusca TaxID=407009 RepID=A0AAE1LSZ0_9NEOP|nr:Cadherin EGF LAG seven-pass G-type receptor 3 [Frankliniella fusca]